MNSLMLVWRNSFRKKSRFILTCASVMVAFFLFTSLAAINHALSVKVSGHNQLRLMTNHKISITRSLPVNYQQKIAVIEGVEQVSYASWFGGYFQNETNQLAMTAVDHQSYFELFDEYLLTDKQYIQWKNTRMGIIIGEDLAEKFSWKVGDNIPLSSSIWMNKEGSFSWQFSVSAIYKTHDSTVGKSRVFLQHAYFDEARAYAANMVSWLSVGVKNTANMDEVAQAIDGKFANSNGATRTMTEQVFLKEQAQQFVDMAMIIKVVLMAVFFTLLLIVCNTILQTHRERLNESAMMKAIGFSSISLIILIYLESLFLLLLGALLGSLLSSMLINEIKQQFNDFLPGIAIESSHYLHIFMIVILVAVVCSFIPAMSIKRLSISKNLGAMA
jgi:putative ABC transport system permease protein